VISDPDVVGLLYLVTIVCFVVALKFLSSPRHARKGNWVGGAGMLVAIGTTLLLEGIGNWALIVAGLVIGSVVGVVGARNVRMTAMPQMVAIFNGVGGGAAALVALSEWHNVAGPVWDETISIVLSALIGSISLAGSVVAFAKLQELVSGRPIVFPGQNIVNIGVLVAASGLGIAAVAGVEEQWVLYSLVALALFFGVMFVLPIGGADMPVVISLLNAFTGIAASATGFVLDSTVLIVSGMLVGAAGTLLTLLMAKAMNRSVANVLFGAFGQVQTGGGAARAAADDGRTVRATTPEDVAVQLSFARKVIVVPGYGMAVAQAQHDVRQLADVLEENGVDVKYAIHPVAGRMPGHMNVLLAEANVPYTQLFEMDEINPEFPQADVVLVIGANDVTNPAARSDPGSPIYGMPILDVDKAASAVVLKRSMNPGFAGIDNELYLEPKTTMLFGDAKDSVVKLISAVKAL
jgi:NAD(P) transhydrogenase subunit beta